MTLQETKDQIAREHGFKDHQELACSPNIPKDALEWYYDRAAELYARSKWDEACNEQLYNVRIAYHTIKAPKPEFKP